MDRQYDDEQRSRVERIVGRDLDEQTGKGRPLSSRAAQTQRSIEAYLKAGVRPRWMERVARSTPAIARERRPARARLSRAAGRVRRRPGAASPRAGASCARSWRFDELNVLIEQHNAWYPIERDLPLNPRTGDYVRVGGRSYRRPVLGADWVLEQFRRPRQRASTVSTDLSRGRIGNDDAVMVLLLNALLYVVAPQPLAGRAEDGCASADSRRVRWSRIALVCGGGLAMGIAIALSFLRRWFAVGHRRLRRDRHRRHLRCGSR